MKKLPIKLENAVTCLYIASIIWCLLFPLVNITTGETKPRGIYVDENALLVSSGISGFPLSNNNENSPQWLNFLLIKDSVTHNSNSVPSFCRFVTSNHASVSCCQIEKSTGTMTKIIVDHPWKARSLEVTTIAISYHSTNKIQSLAYAAALIKRISTSNWLSKRILILLIPLQYDEEGQTAARGETRVAAFDDQNSGTQTAEGNPEHSEKQRIRFSPSLSTWLDEYHAMQPRISDNVFEVPQQPSTQICDGSIHEGLLRDAYVVDLSEPYITSIAAEHCEGLGDCKGKGKGTGKGKGEALWRTIRVLIAGNNGQLPNMDFIAAPLALFPNILTSEAEAEAETEQSLSGDLMTHKILAMFPKNLLPSLYDSIEKLLSRRECRQYLRVMAGLLSFSGALVEGPSGLHGQFIRRNIDALTLRPIAPAPAPALSSTYQNRRAQSHLSHGEKSSHGTSGFESEAEALPAAATSEEGKGEWEWAVQDLLNLLDIVEQCIRLGSNINGKSNYYSSAYLTGLSKVNRDGNRNGNRNKNRNRNREREYFTEQSILEERVRCCKIMMECLTFLTKHNITLDIILYDYMISYRIMHMETYPNDDDIHNLLLCVTDSLCVHDHIVRCYSNLSQRTPTFLFLPVLIYFLYSLLNVM